MKSFSEQLAMVRPARPECLSILGHKFEARYDTVQRDSEAARRATRIGGGSPEHADVVANVLRLTDQIYRGDICVRCGTFAKASR
jgi:hypothetical protein